MAGSVSKASPGIPIRGLTGDVLCLVPELDSPANLRREIASKLRGSLPFFPRLLCCEDNTTSASNSNSSVFESLCACMFLALADTGESYEEVFLRELGNSSSRQRSEAESRTSWLGKNADIHEEGLVLIWKPFRYYEGPRTMGVGGPRRSAVDPHPAGGGALLLPPDPHPPAPASAATGASAIAPEMVIEEGEDDEDERLSASPDDERLSSSHRRTYSSLQTAEEYVRRCEEEVRIFPPMQECVRNYLMMLRQYGAETALELVQVQIFFAESGDRVAELRKMVTAVRKLRRVVEGGQGREMMTCNKGRLGDDETPEPLASLEKLEALLAEMVLEGEEHRARA
eukprot:g14578.t1